jgi:hypothetical protein
LPDEHAYERYVTDISFSSSEPEAVRFSMNDSLCRGALGPFVVEQMRVLAAGYELKAASEFIKVGKLLKGDFQTCAAMEWTAQKSAPVLKLYFEEVPGSKGVFKNIEFGRKILAMAGCAGSVGEGPAPGIVAMDFFPGGATDVKLYFRKDNLPETGLGALQRSVLRSLDKEPRCFYFEMTRLTSGGLKVYKIYEPGCRTDPLAGISEICALYARLRMPQGVKFARTYLRMASQYGFRLIPSSCGVGAYLNGKVKVDAYFRFAL